MAFSGVTARGSSTEKVSDTSHSISPSATLTVGKIVFVEFVTDNIVTTSGASTNHTGVTDTDGHTWTKDFERTETEGAAGEGVTHSRWRTKVISEITTGNVITCNTSAAVTAKLIALWEVTVGSGNNVQIGGIVHGAGIAQNPPGISLSGLSSIERMYVGAVAKEHTSLGWSEDADYTNLFAAEGVATSGGTTLSNVAVNIGTRIATLTGDTFDPGDIASAAPNYTMSLVAYEEVAEGGTPKSLLVPRRPLTGLIGR